MLGTSKRKTPTDIDMDVFLSIIVPTHNFNKNLFLLLDKACDFAKKDGSIEVIIVDSSEDDIYKEILKRQNKNVIVYKSDIARVDIQRNKGMELAKGKYITFFDSDDIVSNDFSQILDKLKTTDSDLILCPFEWTKDNNYDLNNVFFGEGTFYFSREEMFSLFYSSNLTMLFSSPWSKIIKREKILNIRFHGTSFEDSKFIFDILKNIETITFLPILFYKYIDNTSQNSLSSISHQKSYVLISLYMKQYKFLRRKKILSQSLSAIINAYNVWKLSLQNHKLSFFQNMKLSFSLIWYPLFDFRKKPQLMLFFILLTPFLYFYKKRI